MGTVGESVVCNVPMINEHDLLTLRALARRLRIPAEWLRAEVEAGRLSAIRANDELLFHYPTVVRLLTERAAVAPPSAECVRGGGSHG